MDILLAISGTGLQQGLKVKFPSFCQQSGVVDFLRFTGQLAFV